jgi:hypothetical protein
VKKLSKGTIISAVHEAECPMLADIDLETISKQNLIEHLTEACCPVLEKLAGAE